MVSLKVTKLEFLRSTSNNTWGLAFDESGQLFGSTANGCPLVHMPIPNRYYEKVRGLTPTVLPNIAPDNHFEPITDKVRQVDWHGGFTAASNLSIYTARTYPREYWNRAAFLSDPTGHLTATFTLQPDGATYKAQYGWNLLASDDEWTAPIDAQVGPDGHVWVIDWYNFIVQHNPTPQGFRTGRGAAYETPLRDKTHGRIYRVVYTKAKPEPRINLKDATPEKLVETLKHHNLGWRLHAQRLLVERGKKDVIAALVKLVEDKSVDETGLSAGAVHALWALTGLSWEDNRKLLGAVEHNSAHVRRSAVVTMGADKGRTADRFSGARRSPERSLTSIHALPWRHCSHYRRGRRMRMLVWSSVRPRRTCRCRIRQLSMRTSSRLHTMDSDSLAITPLGKGISFKESFRYLRQSSRDSLPAPWKTMWSNL